MVATTPWTMQPARAAGRLMAAALRRSPVAFGTAFGTGYGTGFATATGVMFLDDDVAVGSSSWREPSRRRGPTAHAARPFRYRMAPLLTHSTKERLPHDIVLSRYGTLPCI